MSICYYSTQIQWDLDGRRVDLINIHVQQSDQAFEPNLKFLGQDASP